MQATTRQPAAGADYPSVPQILPHRADPSCGTSTGSGVGVGEAELEQHISNCRFMMERAYALFQAYGNPADRDEAVMWMFRRQDAMRARSQTAQDRMHAEIDLSIAVSAQSRGHL
jgi:hypothetical protein